MSERVIDAVAAETGIAPMELEPLYNAVDPDSLDDLFRDIPPDTARTNGRIEFRLADCRVVVFHDGSIDVSCDDQNVVPSPETP